MKHRYLKNVVTLQLNDDKCTGCGICTLVCPHEVLAVENKRAYIIDRDLCMECGACALNCPFEAVSVKTGVGCAAGIIRGLLKNGEPCCDDGCC